MSEQLETFSIIRKRLEYLGTLSDDDLFERYYPAILSHNTTPFSNFSQENRDSYMRLKFRAFSKSNSRSPHVE